MAYVLFHYIFFLHLLTYKKIVSLPSMDFNTPSYFCRQSVGNLVSTVIVFNHFGFFVNKWINKFNFFAAFSKEEFSSWLEKVVPATIILGAVSLGYIILSSLVRFVSKKLCNRFLVFKQDKNLHSWSIFFLKIQIYYAEHEN